MHQTGYKPLPVIKFPKRSEIKSACKFKCKSIQIQKIELQSQIFLLLRVKSQISKSLFPVFHSAQYQRSSQCLGIITCCFAYSKQGHMLKRTPCFPAHIEAQAYLNKKGEWTMMLVICEHKLSWEKCCIKGKDCHCVFAIIWEQQGNSCTLPHLQKCGIWDTFAFCKFLRFAMVTHSQHI